MQRLLTAQPAMLWAAACQGFESCTHVLASPAPNVDSEHLRALPSCQKSSLSAVMLLCFQPPEMLAAIQSRKISWMQHVDAHPSRLNRSHGDLCGRRCFLANQRTSSAEGSGPHGLLSPSGAGPAQPLSASAAPTGRQGHHRCRRENEEIFVRAHRRQVSVCRCV